MVRLSKGEEIDLSKSGQGDGRKLPRRKPRRRKPPIPFIPEISEGEMELEEIGGGWYAGEIESGFDCRNWPDSVACGGNPFALSGMDITPTFIIGPCVDGWRNVGLRVEPVIGVGIGKLGIGLKMPPSEIVRRVRCEGDEEEVPPPPELGDIPNPEIEEDDIPPGYEPSGPPPGPIFLRGWEHTRTGKMISTSGSTGTPLEERKPFGVSFSSIRSVWVRGPSGRYAVLRKITGKTVYYSGREPTTSSLTWVIDWPWLHRDYWSGWIYTKPRPFYYTSWGRRVYLDTPEALAEAQEFMEGRLIRYDQEGWGVSWPHKHHETFTTRTDQYFIRGGVLLGLNATTHFVNSPDRPETPPTPPIPPTPRNEPMADCCKESERLNKNILLELQRQNLALGVDEFVQKNEVKLKSNGELPYAPLRLIEPRKRGDKKRKPLTSLLAVQDFLIRQIDRVAGHFPFTAKVKDADASKEGDQTVEVEVQTIADALKENLEVSIESRGDGDVLILMAIRILYECGLIHQGSLQSWYMLDALCDYHDFKSKEKFKKFPFAFNPRAGVGMKKGFENAKPIEIPESEREIEKLLAKLMEPTDISIKIREWDTKEKKSQNDLLQEILRHSINAAAGVTEPATPERFDQLVAQAQAILKLMNIQDVANYQQAMTSGKLTRGDGG